MARNNVVCLDNFKNKNVTPERVNSNLITLLHRDEDSFKSLLNDFYIRVRDLPEALHKLTIDELQELHTLLLTELVD